MELAQQALFSAFGAIVSAIEEMQAGKESGVNYIKMVQSAAIIINAYCEKIDDENELKQTLSKIAFNTIKEGIKAAVAAALSATIVGTGFAIAGIELAAQCLEHALFGKAENERKKYRDALNAMVQKMINRENINADGTTYVFNLTPLEETRAISLFGVFSEELIWQ